MTHLTADVTLELRTVTLRECKRFVAEHHRHNDDDTGWRFGVGVEKDGELIGVGTAGNPKGRGFDPYRHIEITRNCTLGEPNACSMIYGALCRAAKALGYWVAWTYTLESEPGDSLRAAGFELDARLRARGDGGTKYSGQGRYVTNLFGEARRPDEAKLRWRRALDQRGTEWLAARAQPRADVIDEE